MNNVVIPLIAGFLLGNEKARNQVGVGLQQLVGQGIDLLNGMNSVNGTGGVRNVPDQQSVPESDE